MQKTVSVASPGFACSQSIKGFKSSSCSAIRDPFYKKLSRKRPNFLYDRRAAAL
jgi:hypothetical protein